MANVWQFPIFQKMKFIINFKDAFKEERKYIRKEGKR